MKKTKRLLSLILAICLIISTCPQAVYAKTTENGLFPGFNQDIDLWDGSETNQFISPESGWGHWNDKKISPEEYPEVVVDEPFWENKGDSAAVLDNMKESPDFFAIMEADEEASATNTEDSIVSTLLIGGEDATATTSGEGWSFDAATGTLILNGANIVHPVEGEMAIYAVGDLTIILEAGSENYVSGHIAIGVDGNCTLQGEGSLTAESLYDLGGSVYATKNLNITDCGKLIAKGTMVGLLCDNITTITNSVIYATADMTIAEAAEMQALPPAAIAGNQEVIIREGSFINTESPFLGMYSASTSVTIVDSTVQANGKYCGILGTTSLTITNSTVEASGVRAGLAGEILAITNSTVSASAIEDEAALEELGFSIGYSIWCVNEITLDKCRIIEDATIGDFVEGEGDSAQTVKTVLDEDNFPAKNVSIEPCIVAALTVGGVDALETPVGEGWSFNKTTGTLTLNGANIETGQNQGNGIQAEGDLTIVVEKGTSNYISGDNGIFVNGNCIIQGGNLTVEGVLDFKAAISVTGDFDIHDCDNLVANGTLAGISSEGIVVIENSTVSAKSDMMFSEAAEANSSIPPTGIVARNNFEIKNGCEIQVESQYCGIGTLEGKLTITGSKVDSNTKYLGLAGSTGVSITDSTVTCNTTATLEELFAGPVPITVGISSYNTGIEVDSSNIKIETSFYGCMNEASGGMTFKDSNVEIIAGWSGLAVVDSLIADNSGIDVTVTAPAKDAMEMMVSNNMIPVSGIFILNGDAELQIQKSDISIKDALWGMAANHARIQSTSINIEGGLIGVLGSAECLLYDCPKIKIVNNSDLHIDAAKNNIASGYESGIAANGMLVLEACEDVSIKGDIAGITSTDAVVLIAGSNVETAGVGTGIFGYNVEINNSNVNAYTFENTELSEFFNNPLTYAFYAHEPIRLVDCCLETEGTLGHFYKSTDTGLYDFETILDENGEPVKNVTISVIKEIANGECGEAVSWKLNNAGTLVVEPVVAEPEVVQTEPDAGAENEANGIVRYEAMAANTGTADTYTMYNYENPEDAPWHEYRDKIKIVLIDDEIGNIGTNSFCDCENLETVSIGNGVTTVGENSFANCTNLTEVSVGESVTTIEGQAFANCDEVKLDFAGDEPVVADNAFSGSTTTITFPAENTTWTEDNESTKNNTYGDTSTVTPKQPEGSTEEEQCEHSYPEEWTTVNEATCTTKGKQIKQCEKCNVAYKEQSIPKLEHSYEENVCITCGREELKFSGASLTLYDNLAINFKVKSALFKEKGYTEPYVVFNMGETTTTVHDYRIVGDSYVFDFTNIAPHLMNETVTATLHATYEKENCNVTVQYSIKKYCDDLLEKYSDNEELRTLLVDLLNYGAAAQVYTAYNTDNLVNSDLSEEQQEWATAERTYSDIMENTPIDNQTVTFTGAGLVLQDSIVMRFKFKVDSIEGLNLKIESGGSEWTIPSSEFEAVTTNENTYYVYFNGLNAGQMSQPVHVTAYKDGEAVSNTLEYSIESYVASNLGKYDKPDMSEAEANFVLLLKNMMKYGDAAAAYVEANSK